MNPKPTLSNFARQLLGLCGIVLACTGQPSSARADAESDTLFENNIRPVLVEVCFGCHGSAKVSAGLRVDSREALLAGGDSGAAIVPGKPEESLLIKAIQRHDDVSPMPPDEEQALRAEEIAAFEAWIKDGANWPKQTRKFESARHWAFQPVVDVPVPAVQDTAWVEQPIDAFIRAKQEAAGLRPASPADRRTLIRRATFDLHGLPPTPEEIAEFENDASPDAFEKVIDRLLASPRYGERWGRHWLDVVRYADTAGETADYPVPLAWRYRNYVIAALNCDKPYDEFLREQIAGDVLAEGCTGERYAELVTATGYLAISRRFGFDSENYHHLTIQDTIDTLGQSVLGLSVGCARCHDHKFDAISMRDYYALYGIFDSSRYAFPGSEQKQKFRSMVPLLPADESMPKWRAFEQRVAATAARLEKAKQPVPAAVLRSLNDIDGDFETQAPAAGGSNGVLVPPWLYQGKIAVTNAAQSPFQNLYHRGKVGASIAAGAGPYRIAQSLYPRRSSRNCDALYVNLDFRVGRAAGADQAQTAGDDGKHRLWLGAQPHSPAIVVLISPDSVSIQIGETIEHVGSVVAGEWHNLQLNLKLAERSLSGTLSTVDSVQKFEDKPLAAQWSETFDLVAFDSPSDAAEQTLPSIEYDNLGVQDAPLAPASIEAPSVSGASDTSDAAELARQLQELTAAEGDFELQSDGAPPSAPWNPGPNSVVKISTSAQSPYCNRFPAGQLGVHMPNRGAYDGFGLSLPTAWKADDTPRLHASVDIRCASDSAGGDGSWRYYIGHGPGSSAAVELFFNGHEFFRRSGSSIDPVSELRIGQWYQIHVTLDLKAKTYVGTIESPDTRTAFRGQMAAGWDGVIDYSFIDSYGHLSGVRPELNVDNYRIGTQELPPLDAPAVMRNAAEFVEARQRVAALRERLAATEEETRRAAEDLKNMLAEGPVPIAYGVTEGTPHNVRIHLRGEPDQLGDEVPRGFIKALGGEPLSESTHGSGRLELAQWCSHTSNPLTARVMANRIWQYHFGQGLVKTPNDFGVRGRRPTHPELLDHLASQFMRSGWSIKAMHRAMMLSATFQQSSVVNRSERGAIMDADPSDFYIRFARRRLSAEEIRDAILLVSGELDHVPGQAHPFPSPVSWGFSQHAPFNAVYDHSKRSVYLMTQRIKRHPFLALFDGPDPNASTPERMRTTVPTQALYFLNDPFIHAKADAWASRLQTEGFGSAEQIEQAHRTALGRPATGEEMRDAQAFLAAYRAELVALREPNAEARSMAAFLRTILASNEFLHVE